METVEDITKDTKLRLSTITMEIQFNSNMNLEQIFNFLPVNYKYQDMKATQLKKIKNFDLKFGENIVALNYKNNTKGIKIGCFNNAIGMFILNKSQHYYCRIFNSKIIIGGAKNVNDMIIFIQAYFVDLINLINNCLIDPELRKQIFDEQTSNQIETYKIKLFDCEKIEITDYFINMAKCDFKLNYKINKKVLCEHFVNDKDSIFCVTYSPSISPIVNIRVYYDVPDNAKYKIKRRKDKNTITFLIYESGRITLSGPCEELCKEIYDIFINEIKLIGKNLIKN